MAAAKKETRFWGWVIDPIKRSIAQSPGAVLVDAQKDQQRWIYDCGIWREVYGTHRAQDADKRHLIQSMRMATSDHLFVDEDGYGKEGLGIFRLEGYPHPLCGLGMVVGAERGHEDWIYGTPNVTLEQLTEWVQFTDTVTTGQVFPGHDASDDELRAILPAGCDLDEWRSRTPVTGWVCGHPVPRHGSMGLHILESRDGAV